MLRAWYSSLADAGVVVRRGAGDGVGYAESRERQRRTVRGLQLESQLQSARLAALRAQLQPHFLYNTLNGIAALVADAQPVHAVAAIERLGELLHASLREDGREEVTVTEEVALAERYLALQGMRFGDRLRYDWAVAPEAAEALVPVLLLQPIVENAVVHGLDAGIEALTVQITAAASADRVTLTVENDGAALAPDEERDTGMPGTDWASRRLGRDWRPRTASAPRSRCCRAARAESRCASSSRGSSVRWRRSDDSVRPAARWSRWVGDDRSPTRRPAGRRRGAGAAAPAPAACTTLLISTSSASAPTRATWRRRCAELRPDVVFLDVRMPHVNGFEAQAAIASLVRHVVFVTAHAEHPPAPSMWRQAITS